MDDDSTRVGSARRYAVDQERMFDLTLTGRLAALVALPVEERPADWLDRLMEALWNGSVEIPDPAFFHGPDGFVYLRLNVPRAGLPFDSNCLARQAEMLVSTARGAALFASPDAAEPTYVLSMGRIDAMLRFDNPHGDPADLVEITRASGSSFDQEIWPDRRTLVGTPSRDYLPPHSARALHRHLAEGWGVASPRVAMMVLTNASPARNLVIDRTIDEIPGAPGRADAVVRMLLWYLPPSRSILLRPSSLPIEDMRPLAEYFD